MEKEVCNQCINWIWICLNLNMFVHNMNILRFFSKLQTFCYRLIGMTTSCLKITCANALVLAKTFSVKFAFICISTTDEFFFLLADIEREKRVKCLIVARCYVGFGYQSIHTKEFNSKQGCITIHPRQFLVGERQSIINCGVSIWV